MFTSAAFFSAVLALMGPLDREVAASALGQAAPTGAVAVVEDCVVALSDESHVAAEQPGKIVGLPAVEGMQVKTGDLLAQIDDEEARMAKEVAEYKLSVAEEKTNQGQVNIDFSKASHEVSAAEYQQAVDANKKMPGTKPLAEVRRLGLAAEKSRLEIVQAESSKVIAQAEAKVSEAEVRAAEVGVKHRRIEAPIDGMVVEMNKHLGEWVQPGDVVAHLVRLDRLRVQGRLKASTTDPAEVDGKPVTVTVTLAHGRHEKFTGEIKFVDPRVGLSDEYEVWAEVLNRKVNDRWVLRPGVRAEMTIDLGVAPPAAPAPPAKVQM